MAEQTPPTPKPARHSRSRGEAPDTLPIEHEGAPAGDAPAAEAPDAAASGEPAPVLGSIHIERGGIDQATAQQVEVRMGGIGQVDADDVFVSWGGIGAARAEQVGVEFGSVGAAMAGELRVTQGMASLVAAREAVIEQSFVRTLIAQHVRISRPSAVLVLIAQRVEGEVRPLLDWRGALAFGAAFGLFSALLKRGRAKD